MYEELIRFLVSFLSFQCCGCTAVQSYWYASTELRLAHRALVLVRAMEPRVLRNNKLHYTLLRPTYQTSRVIRCVTRSAREVWRVSRRGVEN